MLCVSLKTHVHAWNEQPTEKLQEEEKGCNSAQEYKKKACKCWHSNGAHVITGTDTLHRLVPASPPNVRCLLCTHMHVTEPMAIAATYVGSGTTTMEPAARSSRPLV